MKAAVRDEEDAALARRIDKPAHVGEQLLSARYVKLTTWQHKVFLRVYTPQNGVCGSHESLQVCPNQYRNSNSKIRFFLCN